MRWRTAVGILASLALVAAGCGGTSKSGASSGGGSGADFTPASAPAYVSVNTDFGGDQWKKLDALSQKFPDRAQLLSLIQAALTKQGVSWDDVKAALGPETDLGVLGLRGSTGNAVGMTQAQDQGKLDALIKKADQASGGKPTIEVVVDGWTLISNAQSAIDAAKTAHGGQRLSDDAGFKGAMGGLPATALLKFFVNGQALLQAASAAPGWAGAALGGSGGQLTSIAGDIQVQDDGIGLHVDVHSSGGATPKAYTSQLIHQVPAGALVYVSFNGAGAALDKLAQNPQLQSQLGVVQAALGVSFSELLSLFQKEGAIYVRQGSPFPEVTVVLQTDNEQRALGIVNRLATRLAGLVGGRAGAPTTTTVSGVTAKKISAGPVAIYYAAFGGKLVITDSPTGISGLKENGPRLADDAAFKDAKSAAGMPDSTAGFFYVDIKDAVPLIENFAQTAGQSLPTQVTSNLAPLRSFLVYGSASKGRASIDGFLEIK